MPFFKKSFFFTLVLVFLTLCMIPVLVFADGGPGGGIIGAIILDLIGKIPIIGRLFTDHSYSLILVGVVAVGEIFVRKMLDRLPVTWHAHGVNWFWKLMAFLFGEEVLTKSVKLDPDCPEAALKALRERVIKENPILKIKAPWEK